MKSHPALPPRLSMALAIALAGCAASPPASTTASTGTTACKATSEPEIAALFERWNRSLQSGDTQQVVANYAEDSVLLPTVSNKPRVSAAEKADYFNHFLANKPAGKIDWRRIEIGCNSALDSGLYTFTYGSTGVQVKARFTYTYKWNGTQWLISSHHSSALPEKN